MGVKRTNISGIIACGTLSTVGVCCPVCAFSQERKADYLLSYPVSSLRLWWCQWYSAGLLSSASHGTEKVKFRLYLCPRSNQEKMLPAGSCGLVSGLAFACSWWRARRLLYPHAQMCRLSYSIEFKVGVHYRSCTERAGRTDVYIQPTLVTGCV